MSYRPSYVPGDWKAVCQICGRIFKGSKIRRRWDGMYVCQEDWEPKHPQLSVKGVKDDQRAPFVLADSNAGVGPIAYEQTTNISNVLTYSKDLLVGTTAARPAGPENGVRYFDTDLGNIIFSNSGTWVYSNGANV